MPCPHCAAPCDDAHRFCAACGGSLEPVSLREDPMIGRTLPGGYLVQHLAGVGGMGRVYLAEQTALGRTVAVKVIHPHLVGDEHAAGRFITEARASSRLNHPNSIAIFDFGKTSDDLLYLVMEYLRGKDLARVVHEEGPLPFRRVVDILRQALAALEEAHELSIVHRDLKPENIVLEPTRTGKDFVKVVDYGLAKIHEATRGAPVTAPGLVCGTPEYMSPEQGRGDPLDARSDVYSIGVILYQLLAGRLPFDAETPTRLLLAHLGEPPRDPREVAPHRNVPDSLADIALRALAKKPEDRFASARELADALARAAEESDGWDAEQAPTAILCAACGAACQKAMKFCGDCGAPLGSETSRRTPVLPSPGEPASLREREADLAWLEARREEALVLPCAARIVGRAGMGKTTLLDAFLARCAARGDVVARVAATAHARELSGHAVRAVIAELAGGAPHEWAPAGRAAKRGLRDLFAPPRRAHDDEDVPSPIERRAAVAEALKWAIARASDRAGFAVVVLAVDDLDEVDGVSRNAFADVIAEPPLVPSLVVVTYATDRTHAPVQLAEERVLGEIEDGEALRAPLHVEQRAVWARERRDPAPAILAEILAARIEALSEPAQKVLLALAVLGDDAERARVAALVGDGVDLDAAEHALDRAGMRRGRALAHALLRDVALANAPLGVLRAMHARALDAYGDALPLELRAMHAAAAERGFEALVLLDEVAEHRAARGDVDGAIEVLRAGLDLARRELFRGELEDPIHAVVHFGKKLGEALTTAEAFSDAEGVLREALDAVPPNDAARAHVLASLARVAHAREHQRDAQRYVEEALRIARRSDARELVTSLESLERSIA